jgi:predicted GNAT family acetyltransferase
MVGEKTRSDAMAQVVDNTARSRFELGEGGGVSFAAYDRLDGIIVIRHVETPPALRGRGIAGRLMAGILDMARAEGVKVSPICPYAAAYMKQHPETHGLLA